MMEGSIPPASLPLSPTTASSSAIFRPRRSDDWHEYRPAIEKLYRDNQLKLKDVKRIMERDYNFVASYCLPLFLLLAVSFLCFFPSLSSHLGERPCMKSTQHRAIEFQIISSGIIQSFRWMLVLFFSSNPPSLPLSFERRRGQCVVSVAFS